MANPGKGHSATRNLEFTQWSIVKSPQERVLMIRSYDNMQWRSVELSKLDLSGAQDSASFDVFDKSDPMGIRDVTSLL